MITKEEKIEAAVRILKDMMLIHDITHEEMVDILNQLYQKWEKARQVKELSKK